MEKLRVEVARHTRETATVEIEVERVSAAEILRATQAAILFHEDWNTEDAFDYEVVEAKHGEKVVLEYEDLPVYFGTAETDLA